MNYSHYDQLERRFNLTKMQVAAIVKKYAVPKRKIWGSMAAETNAFEKAIEERNARLEAELTNRAALAAIDAAKDTQ